MKAIFWLAVFAICLRDVGRGICQAQIQPQPVRLTPNASTPASFPTILTYYQSLDDTPLPDYEKFHNSLPWKYTITFNVGPNEQLTQNLGSPPDPALGRIIATPALYSIENDASFPIFAEIVCTYYGTTDALVYIAVAQKTTKPLMTPGQDAGPVSCKASVMEGGAAPSLAAPPSQTGTTVGQDDPAADSALGLKYFEGTGVSQDYGQAQIWLKKAADQGNAAAENLLGVMFYAGLGVPKDYGQAATLFKKAADQGDSNGQTDLGTAYSSGLGVPQDYGQTRTWYGKAAIQGNAQAANLLGDMYYNGQGTSKDYGQALTWYTIAANQGVANAQNGLGNMYYNGWGTSQSYAQALEWYTKAAAQGFVAAESSLGYMYYGAHGVPQDYSQAFAWYKKAADQGAAFAEDSLGDMYATGRGVAQDYSQAFSWFKKSADQNFAQGEYDLGFMYEKGRGTAVDYNQALALYQRLANQGDSAGSIAVEVLEKNLTTYGGMSQPEPVKTLIDALHRSALFDQYTNVVRELDYTEQVTFDASSNGYCQITVDVSSVTTPKQEGDPWTNDSKPSFNLKSLSVDDIHPKPGNTTYFPFQYVLTIGTTPTYIAESESQDDIVNLGKLFALAILACH